MRAIGYISLNTLSQQPKNLSLDNQEKMIRDHAADKGWELVKIYREVRTTGSGQHMSELDRIIKDSQQGKFDVVIIPRLDRLTRNIREFSAFLGEVCMNNGVEMISIEEGLDTTQESGKLALNIIDIVAKWDSKRISDRTREIIARKRSKGERVGHAPFGYTYKDKKLVAVKDELDTVRLIRAKREEGMSYHKIAKYLNDRNIASKRGGIWYAETVKTVFQNSLADKRMFRDIEGQLFPPDARRPRGAETQ